MALILATLHFYGLIHTSWQIIFMWMLVDICTYQFNGSEK